MKYAGLAIFMLLALALALPSCGLAGNGSSIAVTLAAPQKEGGLPLMQALNQRKSTRSYTDEAINAQDLSNILWAAWGVNRADGRRTAPTARNEQNMRLYVVLESGVWEYVPGTHSLKMALGEDARAKFGGAPLTLLFAGPVNEESAAMHAGSMYQNTGLYCASANLGNVVKTSGVNALNGVLKLPKGYKVYVVQNIGHIK